MPLYAIYLTGIKRLIEVMVNLVFCSDFLRLVFNVLCQVLNPFTLKNPENLNPIKVNQNLRSFSCFGWGRFLANP